MLVPALRRLLVCATVTLLLAPASPRVRAAAPPETRPSPPAPPRPTVGDVVPDMDLIGVDGKAQKVAFPKGKKTVLLFFLSGCGHCLKMIPEWNTAYRAKKASPDVYGIMMDVEPPDFFKVVPVEFPVLRAPGAVRMGNPAVLREFREKLKLASFPVMMRVGPGGKVEDVLQGEIHDRMRLGQIFAP